MMPCERMVSYVTLFLLTKTCKQVLLYVQPNFPSTNESFVVFLPLSRNALMYHYHRPPPTLPSHFQQILSLHYHPLDDLHLLHRSKTIQCSCLNNSYLLNSIFQRNLMSPHCMDVEFSPSHCHNPHFCFMTTLLFHRSRCTPS